MTREEEILNKAIDYSEIEENFIEYDDCGDVCNDKTFIEKAFIEGATWADEHPKECLVSIDDACEYLESAIRPYISYGATCDFVDTFRKAMEK